MAKKGNRRSGIFIKYEDTIEWTGYAWFAYFSLLDSARRAYAMYKKYGDEDYKQSALRRMEDARECIKLCRALAGPRRVYREERP